jgi:hypothetical protein
MIGEEGKENILFEGGIILDYKKIIEGQIKLLVEINESLKTCPQDYARVIRDNSETIASLAFSAIELISPLATENSKED